jgi:NADH:ubiquinone oxidoreductase subunit 6 (subunit J)
VTEGVAANVVNPQPNIVALGELLYTRFLMPFELAGSSCWWR